MPIKCITLVIVVLVGVSAAAQDPASLIREEQKVFINGVEETWRLEWAGAPKPVCPPEEPDIWSTCPCAGFAFGERGSLTLVRKRPGEPEERLELGKLFSGELDGPAEVGEVVLRRWDVHEETSMIVVPRGLPPGASSAARYSNAVRRLRSRR